MALMQTTRLIFPFILSFSLIACGGGGGFGITGGSSSNPNGEESGVVNGPSSLDEKCTLRRGPISSSELSVEPSQASLTNALIYDGLSCRSTLTSTEYAFIERFENLIFLELLGSNLNLDELPLFKKLEKLIIKNSDSFGNLNETGSTLSDISNLSLLTNLTELEVRGHSITSLQDLAPLTSLTYLAISSRFNPGTLVNADAIQNFKDLKTLILNDTKIENVDFLTNINELEDLRLGNNRINDISGLRNQKGPSGEGHQLDLSNNRISDVTPLANLSKNTIIILNNNRIEEAGVFDNWIAFVDLTDNCLRVGGPSQVADCAILDARDPELIQMGSSDGENFSDGGLEIAIPTLTDGGKTAITASLVGPNGILTDREATITFNSDCIANGTSTITGPIITSSGRATAEYTVKGCTVEDEVTATTSIDGFAFSSKATVTIIPAAIGSMAFESSTPSSIGIRGVGLNETSTVKFIIKDKQGNPVRNRLVNFALNTRVGGATLDPASALSNDEGIVATTVQSGSVATTVRVTATVDEEPSIKTQSEGLSISTGVADQNSFSIAVSNLNPEALDRNGETVQVSVLVADHFNNPVPDGTAINFTTEGGVIDPECLTVKGGCSVEWRSSSPKPDNGRVTVLATMLGEESFVDSTGNGLLDDAPDNFVDLPEAFLDKNENGIFDEGEDEPRDFNGNGQWDDKDGQYNGVLCNTDNITNLCSTEKNTFVRDDIVIIMSGSAANIDVSPAVLDASNGSAFPVVSISDRNGQAIPSGSTIEFSMIGGGSILSDSSFTMLSSISPIPYGVIIKGEEIEAGDRAFLSVKVTTPSGVISVRQFPVKMKEKQEELPPLNAADDFGVTSASTVVNISVLNNDNNTGNIQVVSVSPVGLADAATGVASIVDNTINFIPAAGFSGTANFNYTIEDEEGRTASAKISIAVSELPPLNSENDFATTSANTPVTVSVLDNDNNSGSIQITSVTPVGVADAEAGSATIIGNDINFVPVAGFSGTANFKYNIEDQEGRIASATLSISVSELAPLNIDDDFATTIANTSVTVSVLDNDNNSGSIQITSVTPVGVADAEAGNATINGSNIVFSPTTGFSGTANFKYSIEDSEGRTANAIVSISVAEQAPLNAEDDLVTTPANTPVTVPVLNNDINTGNVQITSVSSVGLADSAAGTVSIAGNGIRFVPTADFTGIATYKYTISGGVGLTADANLIVSVTPVPAEEQ